MSKSPPRELYNDQYYQTCCEGFQWNVNKLSPRLKNFETWIAPRLSGTILDIGHGRGELSIRASRIPDVKAVYSIDYSQDAAALFLALLKKEEPATKNKIVQMCGDVEDIVPHLDVMFDHVIAFDVVEHIYKDQVTRLFNRLGQIIVPGGNVYVVTPLSKCQPNERHVWLASKPKDLFELVGPAFEHKHIGEAKSGEDHMFEFTRL